MDRRFDIASPALVLTALVLTVAALPAGAAIRYKALTTSSGADSDQKTQVEAWIDGPKAKIVFAQAGAPGLETGEYMLTQDGGKTLLLVDPEEKTYVEWNLDAMLSMIGSTFQALGPVLNLKIENVEVKKLGREPGGALHGLATTHSIYSTDYDMTIKVLGMGRTNHVHSTEELWTTTELSDAAMGVWLRNAPHTGFAELDQLVEAELGKVDGFPLKTVTVTETTGAKGKRSSETTTSMEVTELDTSAAAPAGGFEVPAGYERSEAMLPASDEEEKEGSPFGKIFGHR